jgi:hypothetical protein
MFLSLQQLSVTNAVYVFLSPQQLSISDAVVSE